MPVHREVPSVLRNKPRILRISSISLKEGNELIPVLGYWILKELQDSLCLENCSGAKYKIFTVTFLIFNRIKFRFDGFQPHHPTFILTTRILISIHLSLFICHVKLDHCRRHFFFEVSFDTVVIHFLPATLKTLKKRLFSLWYYLLLCLMSITVC